MEAPGRSAGRPFAAEVLGRAEMNRGAWKMNIRRTAVTPQRYLLVVNCKSCGRELPAGIVHDGANLRDMACRAVCSPCARAYQLLARDLRQIPIRKAD